MRHASDSALDTIEPLLEEIRALGGLVERKRGVFYRGGRAFLHFHEDPAGMFADIRVAGEWERLDVTSVVQRRALLAKLAGA